MENKLFRDVLELEIASCFDELISLGVTIREIDLSKFEDSELQVLREHLRFVIRTSF